MRTLKTISSLQSALKPLQGKKKAIGLVPTMGALHEGHMSLIRKSRRENDITVVSIFVNPMQFGPREDFKSYPRPEKNDILLAKNEKVDIIFYPSGKEMYPASFLTSIEVGYLSGILCGASRPGHFRGVATVVGKLLNIVAPDCIYMGQKDAQQALIIKRMIQDLNFPVKPRICPIVRESDGLAMSSRNQHLSAAQRAQAPILYQSLKRAQKSILMGNRNATKIKASIRAYIKTHSAGTIDYIACTDAKTLRPLQRLNGAIMIALAVKFGRIRLIDNIIVRA